MNKNKKEEIVEKRLGISPDYQYNALYHSNFLQSNWHANKLTALEHLSLFNKNTCILDLGSGSGNFELVFGKKVKEITAVDYHKEALEFLKTQTIKKRLKNIKFIHSDIRTLDKNHKIRKYDLVIIVDVIEHIHEKEAQKVIKFLKKILNPGGKVCVITPNYRSTWLYIESFLDTFTIVPHFGGHQHVAQYYNDNLKRLFVKNGFEITFTKSFNLFSFLAPWRTCSTLLCKIELMSNIQFGNLLLGVFKK